MPAMMLRYAPRQIRVTAERYFFHAFHASCHYGLRLLLPLTMATFDADAAAAADITPLLKAPR